ncbi:uncharacterized protein LOC111250674 isoform X1 [Varroa destructor]|uniref:Rrn7/TAF1B C-terminal cyclin domain-containing protein n=2 Tax=Varroa destructor TaxID=109461 RepID=A0A7M7K5X5_VARDE|nr:uncharacterized protein LOC111250674 isoform X1 [Varroa destructor]
MVQCGTCGTEDHFKLVTGFYYCTVCNSQSQHAVEEELELAFEPNTEASRVFTAGRVVGSQKQTKASDRRLRYYRRLSIYNDLLRKLVDELIQLGAPPRLKVAVMELWFKYIDVLEIDVEPYGKLPPFCLKEEFEMAARKIKEDSFGLKKAVFNHISMRYRSMYKQRNKNSWYKQHSVLCGYRPVKAPRIQATGLSEILSSLSTAGHESNDNSMSALSTESNSDKGNDAAVGVSEAAEEASGFGFGTLESGMDVVDEGQSFAFAHHQTDISSLNVLDVSMENSETNILDTANVKKVPAGGDQEAEGIVSSSMNRGNSVMQVEDVDLTSNIAYRLKSYMESRNRFSLEHYAEPVFQMHTSCLIMILYLGIVRAKVFHIGILDIYRFIRQKALTYREPRDGVAEELLKWRQNLFFNMTLPDIHPVHTGMGSFVRSTGILCALLGIPELEMPPMTYFIARIGLDLNLPGEILSMAVKISREYNLQPSWTLDGSEEFPHMTAKPVPLMELEACAVLLFVLKYLFGINGSTEYASSLEAEKRSHKEGVKYFVISHWMTQLSRRAHFLRRRGEYYNSRGPSEFEHIRSAAYLVRHSDKRRADFYQRGVVSRKCARFIDDVAVERMLSTPKLSPSSWPLKNALRTLVQHESPADPLHLLDNMCNDQVIINGTSEFPLALRSHARFYVEAARKTSEAAEPSFIGNALAPPKNMVALVSLLAEYCLCSSLRLHRTLLQVEKRIAQA